MANYSIVQTTDSHTFDEVLSVEYEEPPIEFRTPRATVEVPLGSGIPLSILDTGKELEVKRNGQVVMPGSVGNREAHRSNGGIATARATVRHRGYLAFANVVCTSYDFDEDGDPGTVRDGVTVNPWHFLAVRDPAGALNVYGETDAIDGFRVDQVMEAFAGTKHLYIHDFQDNSHFLASDIYVTTNKLQVYRDGPAGNTRPYLQRTRQGGSTGFSAGGTIESIPLLKGSHFVGPLPGAISTVNVTIIGNRRNADDPTIRVCRNSVDISGGSHANNAARTYTAVSLAHNASWNGSTLSAWTGSVDLSADGASTTNALGYEITLTGTAGDSTTTDIQAILIECVTASDLSGITKGTITAYAPPAIDGLSTVGTKVVESDFLDMNRMEAVETLRVTTESTTATNPSPHWDAYIDGDLAFHFVERRGSAITKTYSFPEENLLSVKHRYDTEELAYQTVAVGPGSGIARTEIKSKEAYSSGGLYDATRDPSSGALYGKEAGVRYFVDQNERSTEMLLHKARAYHKSRRDPIETYDLELVSESIAYFETGDSITVADVPTRSNAALRVIHLTRQQDGGSPERIRLTMGQPGPSLASMLSRGGQSADTITIRGVPLAQSTGLSGSGIEFDKTTLGVDAFVIPHGADVERVLLRLTTLPWQATAKSAASASIALTTTGSSDTVDPTNRVAMTHFFVPRAANSALDYIFATSPTLISGNTYDGVITNTYVWNLSGGSSNYTYKLENITKGTTLFTVTAQTIADLSYRLRTDSWSAAQVAQGDSLKLTITAGQVGTAYSARWPMQMTTQAKSTHVHGITVPSHTHDLVYGIQQFKGDTPGSSPVYAQNANFAIDPADANGDNIPDTGEFNAKLHPIPFGTSGQSQTIEVDITGYLDVDAAGKIKPGEHRVYVRGATASNNTDGLGVFSMSPIITTR